MAPERELGELLQEAFEEQAEAAAIGQLGLRLKLPEAEQIH